MTSQRPPTPQPTDLLIESSHPDFAQTGLKGSATVKLDKLATIDTALLLGELGELSTALLQELNVRLRHALEL
jgi:mRNA interferase MazF